MRLDKLDHSKLLDKQINRLLILKINYKSKKSTPKKNYAICLCDCGNTVEIVLASIMSGNTKSCGCLKKELLVNKLTKHGYNNKYKHSLGYSSWYAMKARCLNKSHRQYKDYGGRGIKICESWYQFSNFIKDMGDRPSNKHSIERINNDGDYEPNNCRWATYKEQANNRRPRS